VPKEKKIEAVRVLAERLSRSTIVIATDYRGLSVSEMSQLRQHLREVGVEYHVVKNTLARFAAEQAGKPSLAEVLQGPVALAFGFGDVVEPARALSDYLRTSRSTLAIKGGLLDGKALSVADIRSLATLPSREVLVAKLLGGMQGPIYGLVNALSAPLRGLAVVLKGRLQQMEEESGSAS
jgi:large subunit ribosomal protein L10